MKPATYITIPSFTKLFNNLEMVETLLFKALAILCISDIGWLYKYCIKLIDKHIVKIRTTRRDAFENELTIDLLGQAIKQARQEQNFTQAELGLLVGVQKAQISKIDKSVKNARFETMMKVFEDLGAKENFQVELRNNKLAF